MADIAGLALAVPWIRRSKSLGSFVDWAKSGAFLFAIFC
jgi:hypothetical protein